MGDYPSTMGERIEVAIKGTGLGKGDFAKALGLARETVRRWIAGEVVPEDQLERIAKLSGKSVSWLRYGLVPSESATVDRYVEGYEQGKKDAVDAIAPAVTHLVDTVRQVKRRAAPLPADSPVAAPIERAAGEFDGRKGGPANGQSKRA